MNFPQTNPEIQRIAMEPVSLVPIGEEDDLHLGDFIEDKESESSDFTTRQLKEELYAILKDLSDREERVIRPVMV